MMRFWMHRLCAAALFVVPCSFVNAQSGDCEQIRKTAVPYEYRMDMEVLGNNRPTQIVPRVAQVYRSGSALKVSYVKQGAVILKISSYGTFIVEIANLSTGHIAAKLVYPGFDIKTASIDKNHAYEQVTMPAVGVIETQLVERSYVGRKMTVVGSCELEVIIFTSKTTTKKTGAVAAVAEVQYSPELQEVVNSRSADAKTGWTMFYVPKSLSSQFTPLPGTPVH